MAHASVQPFRAWASSVDRSMRDPRSPISGLPGAPFFRAGWRVFDELTRRYGKPEFGIESIETDGINHHVDVEIVKRRTFCNLLRFTKTPQAATAQPKAQPTAQPKVLLIAPMSGHFATLLRATVKAMLPTNDVYITDWADARAVPLLQGQFDLHDYIEYLQSFFKELGPDLHVIAVCQPSVPALAATALLAQEDSPYQPKSLTLMAGPVDVANNPTQVNDYAQAHNIAWFKRNVITYVPAPHPGAFRPVYPGFFQLAGFMGMNMDANMCMSMDMGTILIMRLSVSLSLSLGLSLNVIMNMSMNMNIDIDIHMIMHMIMTMNMIMSMSMNLSMNMSMVMIISMIIFTYTWPCTWS